MANKTLKTKIAWWIELLIPIIAFIPIVMSPNHIVIFLLSAFIFIFITNSSHPVYYTITMLYQFWTKKSMPKKETYYEVKGFQK